MSAGGAALKACRCFLPRGGDLRPYRRRLSSSLRRFLQVFMVHTAFRPRRSRSPTQSASDYVSQRAPIVIKQRDLPTAKGVALAMTLEEDQAQSPDDGRQQNWVAGARWSSKILEGEEASSRDGDGRHVLPLHRARIQASPTVKKDPNRWNGEDSPAPVLTPTFTRV